MGVQYTRSGGRPIDGTPYRNMARDLQDIYQQEITVAGTEAKQELAAYFRTRGTFRTWNGSFFGRTASNPAGRIDTGQMRDDLDVRVYRGQGIGLDVGWVHHYEDYYGIQDTGFSEGGFRPDQVVAGMGLMAHMSFWLRDRVDEALDRAGKRVVDGL